MKEDYISYTVGNLFGMALQTNRPNTTDLSGRTMFGWTGVPIIVAKYEGADPSEIRLRYVPATEDHADYIEIVPDIRTF